VLTFTEAKHQSHFIFIFKLSIGKKFRGTVPLQNFEKKKLIFYAKKGGEIT
jgi:hypothetical protein